MHYIYYKRYEARYNNGGDGIETQAIYNRCGEHSELLRLITQKNQEVDLHVKIKRFEYKRYYNKLNKGSLMKTWKLEKLIKILYDFFRCAINTTNRGTYKNKFHKKKAYWRTANRSETEKYKVKYFGELSIERREKYK